MSSKSSKSDRSDRIERAIWTSRRLGTRTVLFHAAVAERLGLNATDHKCADLLWELGPLTAGRLAELTGLTTGAMTAAIDRLERVGFVVREADPQDRRRVVVRATPERTPQVAHLFEGLSASAQKLCERYTDEQLAVIEEFMNGAVTMLEQQTLALRADDVTADSEGTRADAPARGMRAGHQRLPSAERVRRK